MIHSDRILIAGSFGCVIVLLLAHAHPAALRNFAIEDLDPPGLLAKLAAILIAGALLAFFHGIPESFTERKRNALRLLFAIGFIAVTLCSESDWQCFA